MLDLPLSGRCHRRVLVALALASAALPAFAQYPGGAVVQRLAGADDPAEKLAGALRTLAVSPRDLAALIEAGRDALTLGDPNAAVGFFGRASEGSPRDGRVKAGLGAALVQLEKPRDALRYFQEASALGVPDGDLAEDRGLAYDLIGDQARAQRDYRTELAAHPEDDAARRRLALSQGISGDRAAAIATLDPLIRKRDIAAWRAQTFVLAMTGDTAGANDITRIMLPQQQAMLQPFLVRLATLSPGDKARAVHFGEMPAAGRSYSDTQLATSIGAPATYAPAPVRSVARVAPAPVAAMPRPTPAPTRVVTAVSEPPAIAPRPQPAIGHERFVSAAGVPMRRIEHSAQEQLTLGMPRYEYVPIGTAVAARSAATDPAPAVPTRVAASFPVAPAPPSATAATIAAPRPPLAGPPAPGKTIVEAAPAPPAALGATAPSPVVAGPSASITATATPAVASVAANPTPLAPATQATMPLGASGAGGHFDLPHEIADRRPVPRAVQSAVQSIVRPTIVAASSPTPVIAEAASANPTVATARHARTDAATPPPVRRGHARAAPAVADASATETPDDATPSEKPRRDRSGHPHGALVKTDAAVADDTVPPDKPTRYRHGHNTDKATTKDSDDGSSASGRRGHHGDTARTATRESDDAKSDGKRKTEDRHHADQSADDVSDKPKGRHGRDKAEKADAAPKVYVQVAGGANKADMDKAWAGVKAKAPDLMRGRKPATTPLHATNRLLVGPFKDEDEAQAFVNKMAGKGVSGFTFKSAKGQKIDKVDAGK